MKIISPLAVKNRQKWILDIQNLKGDFSVITEKLEQKLDAEIKKEGLQGVLNHLRLCGVIPESYGHDTSEEKQYSKYTDAVLSEAYKFIGLKSLVLKERADAADVEAFGENFSFVGDAKAFRLSRTAKNQKDFKVQAMHGWKQGKPYAMVVCPIYQLPSKNSQIYQQASSQNVCIFTYSHLAVLAALADQESKKKAEALLLKIFKAIAALNPSKEALPYWQTINQTMLEFSKKTEALWVLEKLAALESIALAKAEALAFLANEREKIVRLSHEEAIKELIQIHKIASKIRVINAVADNGLMGLV